VYWSIIITGSCILLVSAVYLILRARKNAVLNTLNNLKEQCDRITSSSQLPVKSMLPTQELNIRTRKRIASGELDPKKSEAKLQSIANILSSINRLLSEELPRLKTDDEFAQETYLLARNSMRIALINIYANFNNQPETLKEITRRAESSITLIENVQEITKWSYVYQRCAISSIELFHFRAFL
jgi:hypothetical protein